MKKIAVAVLFTLLTIILTSCAGQKENVTQPVPEYVDDISQNVVLVIDDIIETKGGAGNKELPEWLAAYFIGGIEEVEKMKPYLDKYLFIVVNNGVNFLALNKWAENYSVIHDFPRVAAARIEKRLMSDALFSNNVYEYFFERLVKKAFSAEYTNALIEGTFWIKSRVNKVSDTGEINGVDEKYEFFVFISADKTSMHSDIDNMITETLAVTTLKRGQRKAINSLRQTFFEGF